MWCIPPHANAEFVCHMEDVLEVYRRPYDAQRPLVCMDENSKQLLEETRMPLPAKPGQKRRVDPEYQRHGVNNLFLFFAPLEGWRDVQVTDHRTKGDWAYAMKTLSDVQFPEAERIIVVLDNLNIHRPSSFYEVFEPTEARRLVERFEFHYTPKHGSWLNMAEIEFSILSRQCLNRRIPEADTLRQETAAWVQQRNAQQAKVTWRFTTADARIKLIKLYPSISM